MSKGKIAFWRRAFWGAEFATLPKDIETLRKDLDNLKTEQRISCNRTVEKLGDLEQRCATYATKLEQLEDLAKRINLLETKIASIERSDKSLERDVRDLLARERQTAEKIIRLVSDGGSQTVATGRVREAIDKLCVLLANRFREMGYSPQRLTTRPPIVQDSGPEPFPDQNAGKSKTPEPEPDPTDEEREEETGT